MRIRKRPPPSSLSSAPPLSDPQLCRSLVVQPHLHGNNLYVQEGVKANRRHSDPQNQQPTCEETTSPSEKPMWDRNRTQENTQQKDIEGKDEIKDERWKKKEEEESSNDNRRESISGAETDTQFPDSSSSPPQVDDRWGDGDKVVPLKKSKGSFERVLNVGEEDTILKAKRKSKTNKKCIQSKNGSDHGQEEEKKESTNYKEGFDHDGKSLASNGAKKNKRGSVIMVGSRCSRVNGRGWRCCQQTLVGYSLCEHHLGKGRLRSMASVRNRAMALATPQINAEEKHDHETETARLLSLLEKRDVKSLSSNNENVDIDDEDDDEERKPLMVTKKRMKLGAVKARSISSLLGQAEE